MTNRQEIFGNVLFSFDAKGHARFNLALMGRGKKNWKSADLIFAALYRLLAWFSPGGNQCYVLANDLDQANDDLELAKKLAPGGTSTFREFSKRRNENF
jgi:hypothetical protein